MIRSSVYPDPTFTLRLSYGAMRGWNGPGEEVRPWTALSRAFARATRQEPFRIPERWLAARERLAPATRANFITDNDVVGGNSGSPMLNAHGELVGLVFDGNIHSIAGSYWFDERMNRTVAVHPAFLRAALEQVSAASAAEDEKGSLRRIEPLEHPRRHHLVAQAPVLGVAAVAPDDSGGLRERGDLAHPAQQARMLDVVGGRDGRGERGEGFGLVHRIPSWRDV